MVTALSSNHQPNLQQAPTDSRIADLSNGQHPVGVQQMQPFQLSELEARIDVLRKAIRANRVNFPVPVPIFPSQFRPDIQWRVVLLYFIHGWSAKQLADRYGVTTRRIQQSLQLWADCAVSRGYLQEIPPETVLAPPAV